MAVRSGERWIRWKRGLRVMDDKVERRSAELQQMPYESLVASVDEIEGESAVFLGRSGCILRLTELQPDQSLRVILAGIAPMRWWPLGSWKVIAGFDMNPDGEAQEVAFEVLDEYW